MSQEFEIFLVAVPGLETALCEEARAAGFAGARVVSGGVAFEGGWLDAMRANLVLRGASRVLVRIASFRAMHLAQLDKRARKLPWGDVLRADVPVSVEATCRKSRIYHAGAAAQRIARAIGEELGAPVGDDAPVKVKARIEDDLCTISIDTSGEGLHRRGHKQAVNKAPMRETLAALFLRQCGYKGDEPVLDPMCGSGTFVIEAAEIAAGLLPGRDRGFAFEHLNPFDADAWAEMRRSPQMKSPTQRFLGSDRDAGAIRMSRENAGRAGVVEFCAFEQRPISEIQAPEGPPGLVIINPPYGARIGERQKLFPLYREMGQVLMNRFRGWRVGLIAADATLAKATGLPFLPPAKPVDNGGISITLWRTEAL
ncbi:THUMP domain-containing class I SAM-dependent RNA methyltransferase [Pelagibacterium limicola]|uniref:THUMP domain-containing class I SAM-dependent RNA methyltransferase n=1 Tax=Pelagibacterium limicola TaxID=2791022 RepID=UPI0018AF7683|nr:class I SAM-dependent RNA methyltransferase [Pelagibacterium limicola]